MAKFSKDNQPGNRGRKKGSVDKLTKALIQLQESACDAIAAEVDMHQLIRDIAAKKPEVLLNYLGKVGYKITPDDLPQLTQPRQPITIIFEDTK